MRAAREPPFGDSLARCTSTVFRRPPSRTATPLRARGHLSTTPFTFTASRSSFDDLLTARGRRFAGCWRVFQRSPAHAVQRSCSCTSFDAHAHVRFAMSARGQHRGACVHLHLSMSTSARNPRRQVPLRLSTRASGLLNSLRCLPVSACIFRRPPPPPPRHQLPLSSFNESFRRHSCRPPPC
jgi:hypothetical protein